MRVSRESKTSKHASRPMQTMRTRDGPLVGDRIWHRRALNTCTWNKRTITSERGYQYYSLYHNSLFRVRYTTRTNNNGWKQSKSSELLRIEGTFWRRISQTFVYAFFFFFLIGWTWKHYNTTIWTVFFFFFIVTQSIFGEDFRFQWSSPLVRDTRWFNRLLTLYSHALSNYSWHF